MEEQLFYKVRKPLAILLLVCFFMSITITAVSATSAAYQIGVKTGTATDAGTDSSVYIILVGTLKTSKEMLLDSNQNNFENGQLEFFNVKTSDLGNIYQVKIRKDHTGKNPDWYLDYITVAKFNANQKEPWAFPYYDWISDDYRKTINP